MSWYIESSPKACQAAVFDLSKCFRVSDEARVRIPFHESPFNMEAMSFLADHYNRPSSISQERGLNILRRSNEALHFGELGYYRVPSISSVVGRAIPNFTKYLPHLY